MAAESLFGAQTTTYGVQFVHRRNEGIVVNPVAGAAPQHASMVRLHAPLETLSVYWTAVRQGAPPIVPSTRSYRQNLNRVFLGGSRIGSCTPAMFGHFWVVSGNYEYLIVAPETLDSDFALARCPWETDQNLRDFYVPYQHFQEGIINDILSSNTGIALDPDVAFLEAFEVWEPPNVPLAPFIP